MGAIASIGTVGDSYDNAPAETVVGLYKNECVKIDGPFRGADDLELATLSWVHWFNENRLHSSIGYTSRRSRRRTRTTVRTSPDSTRCRGSAPSLNPGRFKLRIAIITWSERTYYRRRWQARLGRLTAIEFETIMNQNLALAA